MPAMPKRLTFDSSVIAALTYNADDNTLVVEFTNDHVYRYWMIPAATYEAFVEAPSLGQYFNSEIRDRFPYRQLK